MPEKPEIEHMKIGLDKDRRSELISILQQLGGIHYVEIEFSPNRQPVRAVLDIERYNPEIVTWLKDEASKKIQPVITAESFRQFAVSKNEAPSEGQSIANALLRRYAPISGLPQPYLFYNQTTELPVGVLANHMANLYLQIQTTPQFFPGIGEDRAKLIGQLVEELYVES